MPKNEVDPEDPLELNGVALLTDEDTQAEMAACFVEEFLRLGHDADQILALFLNPHYLGAHMVVEQKGEAFVRGIITETFRAWGRPCDLPTCPAPPDRGSPEPQRVPTRLALESTPTPHPRTTRCASGEARSGTDTP